jgi:hypothetical protein
MLTHWLRKLTAKVRTTTRPPRRSRPLRPRLRPGVEQLEGRLVLTSTTLTLAPNTVPEGQFFTETAHVADSLGNAVAVGEVTFSYSNGNSSGPFRLEGVFDGTIQKTVTPGTLPPGKYTVTANYGQGGPALPDSSDSQQLDVQQVSEILASLAHSTYYLGQDIILGAQVLPHFNGDPVPTQGVVEFFVDGKVVGSQSLNSTGASSFDTSTLPLGDHTLTVRYDGAVTPGSGVDFASTGMSNAVSFTVAPVTTSTAVVSSADVSSFGQSVTFTATVTSPAYEFAGFTTLPNPPSGFVLFNDNTTGKPLGRGALDANGHATFTTSDLAAGTHIIAAAYFGDGTYPASFGTVTQTVNPAPTTTTVSSSANPSSGGPITFTATVTGPSGMAVPSGSVLFNDNTTGKPLGRGTLDANGHATFTTSDLAVGTHTIAAAYLGDNANFAASFGTLTETVAEPPVVVPTAPVLVTPAPSVPLSSPLVPQALTGVTGLVEVLVINRRHGGLQQTLLLFNSSGQVISGTFYLVLDGLSREVHLKNGSGKIPKGHPHAGAPFLVLPVNELQPWQSLPLTLSFSAADGAVPHFTPVLLAGSGVI